MGIIAPNTKPSGPAGGDLTGSYPSPELAENSVDTEDIQNEAVTNQKILKESLVGRLAFESVTSGTIQAGAVETNKIPNGAITSAKLAEALIVTKGLGVFGKAPPAAQHAALPTPKTLLEVENWAKEVNEVLKSFGLTA